MTFNPFFDFETRGYLRNFEGEKDLAKLKHIEHASFLAKLDAALDRLSHIERLSYHVSPSFRVTVITVIQFWQPHL